jgi:hypothetical protein
MKSAVCRVIEQPRQWLTDFPRRDPFLRKGTATTPRASPAEPEPAAQQHSFTKAAPDCNFMNSKPLDSPHTLRIGAPASVFHGWRLGPPIK